MKGKKKTGAVRLVLSLALLSFCSGTLFAAAETAGKRYAILIGINDYADSNIIKLSTPRNDAAALGRDLEASGWDKVFVLTDDVDYRNQDFPSRTNIENRIHLLADLVKPEDTIFLFFSGHGVNADGESSILPVDASLNRLSETSVRISSLVSIFNDRGIRKVILAVDACREQVSTTKGISVVGVTASSAKNAAALTLYATKAGWYSYEDESGKNSVFTRCMLEGLSGAADGIGQGGSKDGIVTFSELAAWLPDATGSYALDRGIRQQAVAFNGSGDSSALAVAATRVSATAWQPTERVKPADTNSNEIAPIVDSIKGHISGIVADSLKIADEKLAQANGKIAKRNAADTAAKADQDAVANASPDSGYADARQATVSSSPDSAPEQAVSSGGSPADSSPRGVSLIQLSFVGPLQCVPGDYDIYGLALGIMSTYNHAVYGMQYAPVAIAGPVRGFQTGVVCVADSIGIIQAGGAFGYAKAVYGLQVSPVNVAGTVNGVQIGVVNVASTVHGIQIGAINVMQNRGILGNFMIGFNIGL